MERKLNVEQGRTIDLHTHTVYSDGGLTPEELVKKAAEIKLAAVAIADHESVAGIKEGLVVAKKFDIELVPAVEISAYPDEETEFHIIGYYIDWQNEKLRGRLAQLQNGREERAKEVCKKLEKLGYKIKFEDVKKIATGIIVQPHIAYIVVQNPENREKLRKIFGKIPTTGDFIREYLIPGKAAYAPRETMKPAEAIDFIHKYAGVAVLAHPCWSITKKVGAGLIFKDRELVGLKKLGLDGVEALAHRESEEDTRECVAHFSTLAKKLGLLITGGSDFHGFGSAGKGLGFSDFYLKVPYQVLENLKLKRKAAETLL